MPDKIPTSSNSQATPSEPFPNILAPKDAIYVRLSGSPDSPKR